MSEFPSYTWGLKTRKKFKLTFTGQCKFNLSTCIHIIQIREMTTVFVILHGTVRKITCLLVPQKHIQFHFLSYSFVSNKTFFGVFPQNYLEIDWLLLTSSHYFFNYIELFFGRTDVYCSVSSLEERFVS